MDDVNPRAIIGDNKPPPAPFELIKGEIDDLYAEAGNWLDGEPITTPEIAAEVSKLEDMIKDAIKRADSLRKSEAKVFDDGKAEVQARYNLLIGETKSVTGTAVRALEVCKKALTPYRVKVQAEKDAEAKRLRDEAEEKARVAREAHQATQAVADLAAREESDRLLREAEQATKAANKAERTATTKTGLRVTYSAEVTNAQQLARHVWLTDQNALSAFLQGWADGEVKRHGQHAGGLVIPGVTIHEHKEAR